MNKAAKAFIKKHKQQEEYREWLRTLKPGDSNLPIDFMLWSVEGDLQKKKKERKAWRK